LTDQLLDSIAEVGGINLDRCILLPSKRAVADITQALLHLMFPGFYDDDPLKGRPVRDAIVFIGVAQEKAQAFSGHKVNGQFHFDRDKTVYVNHYYFYIDDAEFGPVFIKVCSYAPWSIKL